MVEQVQPASWPSFLFFSDQYLSLGMKKEKPSPKDLLIGPHAVREALLSEQPISKIWVKNTSLPPALREIAQQAHKQQIPLARVPLIKLQQLTRTPAQGVVALRSPVPFQSLSQIIELAYEAGKAPIVVVLDQVQDVRNVGAIARSAAALGVDALVIGNKSSAPITSAAMKTSLGALHQIPICRFEPMTAALELLKSHGLTLWACTEKASTPLYTHDLSGPMALILGGEEKGIAPEHLKLADHAMQIPMEGSISSLNVSVAGGIALYEIARQRIAFFGNAKKNG